MLDIHGVPSFCPHPCCGHKNREQKQLRYELRWALVASVTLFSILIRTKVGSGATIFTAMLGWLHRRILLVGATSYMRSNRNRTESRISCWDLCWKIVAARPMCYTEMLSELPLSFWTRPALQSQSHRIAVRFPWLGTINHGCMPPRNKNVFF